MARMRRGCGEEVERRWTVRICEWPASLKSLKALVRLDFVRPLFSLSRSQPTAAHRKSRPDIPSSILRGLEPFPAYYPSANSTPPSLSLPSSPPPPLSITLPLHHARRCPQEEKDRRPRLPLSWCANLPTSLTHPQLIPSSTPFIRRQILPRRTVHREPLRRVLLPDHRTYLFKEHKLQGCRV